MANTRTGHSYSPTQIGMVLDSIAAGMSQRAACEQAGISYSGWRSWRDRNAETLKVKQAVLANKQKALRPPNEIKELRPEAKRALKDFSYFQRRYFGRLPSPWQKEAADKIVQLLESPQEEYCVINLPPGSGKSTLFAHDIPAWVTCRNRRIRGLIGSSTQLRAEEHLGRLRRSFERTEPELGEPQLVKMGLAYDAEATLAADFGRFQPPGTVEIWSRQMFVVLQEDGTSITEKEPTWSAFGRNQEFLGGRYDFIIWDDLVVPRRLRSMEMVEEDRTWFDTYAESRLEPGGLFLLEGQRIGLNDLYRYALNKVALKEGEEDSEPGLYDYTVEEEDRSNRKYHHIVFKAHYDEKCEYDRDDNPEPHKKTGAPYPEGCLLMPWRLTWRRLWDIKTNRPDQWEVWYQQQDADPSYVLVDPAWISGNNGQFRGCWDMDRDRLEFPKGLEGGYLSIITCDPSPTNYWAIEWWLYHEATEQRILMDLERRHMDAPDFIDWNYNANRFTGLLDEWWETSAELGVPVTHLIVEDNAAQRFLLQYDHVRRWQSLRSVNIISHTTHRNKSDPQYGVQSIAPHYQFGRIRLPGKVPGLGRTKAMKLVDEVTRYPQTEYDDCLMAHWFLEWQLPHITRPKGVGRKLWRPSWVNGQQAIPSAAEQFLSTRVRTPA